MPRYSSVLAALVGLVLASSSASAAPDVSVAVLGLEPVDVPEPLAQQLTDALRQRASSTSGVRTVQGKDLIEVKMVFGCDGELPACMAQAGKTLGADKLLYGTVKKGGSKNAVTVALKLLDVKTAVVEKFVNDTVQKRELAGANVNAAAAQVVRSAARGRGQADLDRDLRSERRQRRRRRAGLWSHAADVARSVARPAPGHRVDVGPSALHRAASSCARAARTTWSPRSSPRRRW